MKFTIPVVFLSVLAFAPVPANAGQVTGIPGVAGGTTAAGPDATNRVCANNPAACAGESSKRRGGPRDRTEAWPPKQRIPRGYYRDDKPPRKVRPPKYRDPRYYRPYPPERGFTRISCRQAHYVLQDHGFYRIHTRDCRGRYYSFRAYWNGHRYIVSIRSRDGRIVRVDPV